MANYKSFKMKGHSLPGPNQRKSPAKHSGAEMYSQERNPSIDRNQSGDMKGSGAETIRKNYLKDVAEHDAHHTKYGSDPSHTATDENTKQGKFAEVDLTKKTGKGPRAESSPAKCPLIAALAPMAIKAVSGAMSKKKEE